VFLDCNERHSAVLYRSVKKNSAKPAEANRNEVSRCRAGREGRVKGRWKVERIDRPSRPENVRGQLKHVFCRALLSKGRMYDLWKKEKHLQVLFTCRNDSNKTMGKNLGPKWEKKE
jgi:hypothetical protein